MDVLGSNCEEWVLTSTISSTVLSVREYLILEYVSTFMFIPNCRQRVGTHQATVNKKNLLVFSIFFSVVSDDAGLEPSRVRSCLPRDARIAVWPKSEHQKHIG